jgi:Electron transfer DM13
MCNVARWSVIAVVALLAGAGVLTWTQLDGEASAAPIRTSAKFTRLAKIATGRAVLVVDGDERRLIFRNFEIEPAPDLFVYVVPGVGLGGDIRGGTRISRLRRISGPQEYRIPDDFDVDLPMTVVIWCAACHQANGQAQFT